MTKRLPDARTTIENVKVGILDESYLAISPFNVDERRVRHKMQQRAVTNGNGAVGRHSAKSRRARAEKRG